MNHLSHIVRSFNRFELKYLFTLSQAERLKSSLAAYLVPDEHSHHEGRYNLASLYYDSPDLRCYWEKVDGLKYRRKLRIRCYETGEPLTDDTPVFVEIKQRVDRVTQKRRAVLRYADALRLCDGREIPAHTPVERPIIEEAHTFLWQYDMRPTSLVRYERQAFIGVAYDIGLRVTFDTALTSQCDHLRLHEPPRGQPMLAANWAVMEIKVNERLPYWLTQMVAAHNLQLIRISKYCRSIEVVREGLYPAARAASRLQTVDFYPQEESSGHLQLQ